ncbi:hypothetical protein H6F86_02035 [Phormidium sp. FACHB-592]|uniref:FtsK domain-containing protein n=1 Tax=Stenomitos frigidus AS-A4 TaxID=2933935 RepID=A0ABV0KJR4_9CYAN|nr:hypothetical protein [Phormidium sp. FACHB-592]MBD2072686.1 hypothetical protein [Phormidium sp. FACHB-592]
MKDPYLPQILGLLAAGMTATGLSISGYLHQPETFRFLGTQLTYQAAYRKIPLSLAGSGLCISAWLLTQSRRDYRRQYEQWERQALMQQQHMAAIQHESDLQGYSQLAQLQTAEKFYPQMAPYLDVEDAEFQEMPSQPQSTQQATATAPGQAAVPVTPSSDAIAQPGIIAERDLTAEIAQYDGHILIASRTRSGKTTSVQSAIRHTHSRYNGVVDFWVFDPKGAAWCGLERTQNYLFCNEPRYVPQVLTRLESLIGMMQLRQQQRMQQGGHYRAGSEPKTVIIAIDEFNSLLSLAQEFDESFPSKENPRTQKKIQRYVERLIFQGAEDKVYLWLMAQTTRVEQLGLNTSVQDNMAYFAQSRNGDYQSVEDAISNNYVVSNPTQRKELNSLLTTYRYDQTQDLKIPIAFTTLGGNQLCKLPDLSQAKHYQLASIPQYQQPSTSQPQAPLTAQKAQPDFRSQITSWLKDCWEAELPQEESKIKPSQVDALTDWKLQSLAIYLRKKGEVAVREVKQNWGKNNGLNSEQVQDLLIELMAMNLIETFSPLTSRAEWVRWAET